MRRLLVISNGHGEMAIAERIAGTLLAEAAVPGDEPFAIDHFPLVGTGRGRPGFAVVGPRAPMPSGGLVAMGNVRAIARDVAAGFVRLLAAQLAFVRRVRYDGVVAVGDVYALGFAMLVRAEIRGRYGAPATLRAPAIFVGTAKSVAVAPYGAGERRILARARRVFVRDASTAAALVRAGVPAEAPGNVIVDLLEDSAIATPAALPPLGEGALAPWVALLPGSREPAYADAVRLLAVLRRLAESGSRPAGGRAGAPLGVVCSVAPGLRSARFIAALEAAGWHVSAGDDNAPRAFTAVAGAVAVLGWRGSLRPVFEGAALAIGQGGTANEQAAAAGVPVVALGAPAGARTRAGDTWYRMRQQRLLGDALALVPPETEAAAGAIAALLGDAARLARMSAAGRERMGGPGGAAAIARAIRAELLS